MSQSLGDDRGLNVTQPMTFGTCKGFGMTWYIWYDHGGVLGVLDTRRLSSNTCTNFGNNVLSLSRHRHLETMFSFISFLFRMSD